MADESVPRDPEPEIGSEGPVVLTSELICPECGSRSRHEMPVDACQWFLDCPACGTVLRPKPGDCCVFCSYGSVPCPPIQNGAGCCARE